MKPFLRIALLSTILSTGLVFGAPAATQIFPLKNPAFTITRTLSPLARLVRSDFMDKVGLMDPKAVQAFYIDRDSNYYWAGMMGPTMEAERMIGVLEHSWQHGLNPATYHIKTIKNLQAQNNREGTAKLDVLLTDAFIRYVHDMSGMRVDVASLGMDASFWKKPYNADQTLEFLEKGQSVTAVLNSVTPQSQTYRQLQRELIALVQKPPEPYLSVLPISFGDQLLRPNERHKSVPDLRLRLGLKAQTEDKYLYDDWLAGTVMKFQRDNGLPADGMIGPATLKLLNRSDEAKMTQVVVNLERLRWVDESRPGRFVMVNIPAATLWAIDNNRVQFEIPVIVGKPERPTKPFIAKITGVRFNPDWTVPSTIKKEDILPKLQADPDYLGNKGMELIHLTKQGAETIDPNRVDWNDISTSELASLQMVQMPGAHNPLGRIRILMPNKYDIYLHDTNQPEYFEKNQRAASSGCIRLKEPEKMAAFVMGDEKGWDAKRLNAVLDAGKTRDEQITEPFPVYILYYTAWADEYGRIIFGNDIYGLDEKLIQALSDIDGFDLPGHNKRSISKSAQAVSGAPKLADAR
jgi:murein L,D-transpeptidase YcbB/YkuD